MKSGVDLPVQIFIELVRRPIGGVDRGCHLRLGLLLLVRQRIPNLLPKEAVSPLEDDVVLQQQPQVGIQLVVFNIAQEDKDHFLVAIVDGL